MSVHQQVLLFFIIIHGLLFNVYTYVPLNSHYGMRMGEMGRRSLTFGGYMDGQNTETGEIQIRDRRSATVSQVY